VCSDIHTTKDSGGHESFVKKLERKNAGTGWQLKKNVKNLFLTTWGL